MLENVNSKIINAEKSDSVSIKHRKAEVLRWLSAHLDCGVESLGFMFNDMPEAKSDMTPLSIPDFR